MLELARPALFLFATAGHFGLTAQWIRRGGRDVGSDPEAWFFQSMVVGLGGLQVVLHVLACSVGISLPAGVAALLLLHTGVWAALRRPGAVAVGSGRAPAEMPGWRTIVLQTPWVAVVGSAVVVACVCSWLLRAADEPRILGIDSQHYHVPYAVNFAHGITMFGLFATPHPYPVGTSLLAAWCYHAVGGPLLLDLVNLLPFLLLLASMLHLFRLLTNASGWEWAVLVGLLLYTGQMFRVSLFISADLFYAATFAALFTVCCRIWNQRAATHADWLAAALSTGMLLSSKPQGVMSAGLLLAFVSIALGLRRLAARRATGRLGISAGVVAWSLALVVASGGVWLIRNWLVLGSPTAPVGLQLFGVTIFPGSMSRTGWLSIATDMHDKPGYNLWQRFVVRSHYWGGPWLAGVSVGWLALLADGGYQLARQRRLSEGYRHKLFALGLFLALFAVHALVLIQTDGTSIELYGGQTVRYVIPFYALYPLLAYACCFSDALPWARRLRLQWVAVLPALFFVTWRFNELTNMNPGWNQMNGRENMLDPRWLPLAAVLVVPWWLAGPPPARRWWRRATVVTTALVLAGVAVWWNRQYRWWLVDVTTRVEASIVTGRAARWERESLYRTVTYARAHALPCPSYRFFTMSRFDYPVDLQDPAFTNLVFDVQTDGERVPRVLDRDGPGRTACDFIIVVPPERTEPNFPGIPEADIVRKLRVHGTLDTVADIGRYRVYYARPPGLRG